MPPLPDGTSSDDASDAADALAPEDSGPDCGAGWTYCGVGGCRNLEDDPHACGACAVDCVARFTGTHVDSASVACHSAACAYACSPGFADCADAGEDGGSACAADLSLAATCGSCGTACGAGYLCAPEGDAAARDFACASSCPAGTPTVCGGACVNETANSTTNATNCGGCGPAHDCDGGQICQSSACACPSGETLCSSGCTNVHGSDVNNCGACGKVCKGPTTGSGQAVCNSGTCGLTCTSPTPNTCGPGCVNCTTSVTGATSTCNGNGACTVACTQSGYQICGSACVNTTSDNSNCGSCNGACSPASTGEICVSSTCRPQFAVSVTSFSATQNVGFSGQVATFSDIVTGDTTSSLTATINWGDGNSSTGTIAGSSGSFTVSGSHTYGGSGSFTVVVTVKATATGATQSGTATITIGACTPGDTECSGGVQQSCLSGGMWGNAITCPYLCVAKVCGGQCKPGAVQCDPNNDSVETCQPSGTWMDSTNCASSSQGCSNGACHGTCVPGSLACDTGDDNVETCQADGTFRDTTNCANTTQGCLNGACSGGCVPGTLACDNGSPRSPEKCESDGTWQSTGACPTSSPYICQSGSCVANTPINVGNSDVSASTWEDFEPAPGTVYLTNFTAPTTATVVSLDVNGRVTGGACDLYIYSDNGGTPYQRLTYEFAVDVLAGFNGAAPSVNVTLTAGQQYWVGGICSNPGGTVELYQNSTLPAKGYVAGGQTFGDIVPSTFPTGTTRGNTYSFFLEVLTVP